MELQRGEKEEEIQEGRRNRGERGRRRTGEGEGRRGGGESFYFYLIYCFVVVYLLMKYSKVNFLRFSLFCLFGLY